MSQSFRQPRPYLAAVLLVCLAATVLPAQQAGADVHEDEPVAIQQDRLQQTIDHAERIAGQLDELRETVSEDLSFRQLARIRFRLIVLIDEAQKHFATLRLIHQHDTTISTSQTYRTRLFASLRRQAEDAGSAARLTEIITRTRTAMQLLLYQLNQLQQATPSGPSRTQDLSEAKAKLDHVHEIIVEPPATPQRSRWLDWVATDSVTSYSRGMLWFFLILVSAAALYLLVRWLIARPPPSVDTAAAIGGMAETVPLESPERHRRLAIEARSASDLRLALHHFQLMGLSTLDQARLIALDHGRTNWELHEQLLSRRQNRLAAVLADMNRTYDRKWYGGEAIAGQDVDDFARLAETLHREVGHETI